MDIINNDIDMDDLSISSEVSHDKCYENNNIETNQARDNADNSEIKKEELTPEKYVNDFISNYFSAFDNNPKYGILKLCTILISAIFKSEVAGGMLEEESLEFFKRYYRKTVFSPHNILQEMDMKGGVLNYTGIELLRNIEMKGIKFSSTILPSRTTLQRYARKVELIANNLCPVQHYEDGNEFGEGFRFDFEKTIKLLLKTHSLTGTAATRKVELSSSIDGATLTKSLGFVGAGVKLIDIACKHPITNECVNIPAAESCLTQSKERCFPFEIVIAKDNQNTYRTFEQFFTFIGDAASDGEVDENSVCRNKIYPEFLPFNLLSAGDMVGHNKCLKKGGCSFTTENFCIYCDEIRSKSYVPKEELCSSVCEELHANKNDWQCYHQKMLTNENVSMMEEKRQALEELVDNIDYLITEENMVEERLFYSSVVSENLLRTFNSIYYQVNVSAASELITYNNLVNKELRLRNIPTRGSLETKRTVLLLRMKQEYQLKNLRQSLNHANPDVRAFYSLLTAMPCILHGENHICLKILKMILIEGYSNCLDGSLYSAIRGNGSARFDQYVKDVERLINYEILGDEFNPSQWHFPLQQDVSPKRVGELKSDNNTARKLLTNSMKLIEISITDNDRKELYISCINNILPSLTLLRKKTDFTDDDINKFQELFDEFFQRWVQLWGEKSITNYIHIYQSGHISELLFHWRNLYKYSQQGWEALNGAIKTFFFRRTNRGGHTGKHSRKSKLKAISRWLQRRLIFMCGFNEDYIVNYRKNNTDILANSEEDVHD